MMLFFLSGLFLDSNRMLQSFESLLLLLVNVTAGPDGNLTHGWKSRGRQSYTQLGWTGQVNSSFWHPSVE